MKSARNLGYRLHLGFGNHAEHIAVEMDDAALVFDLRKYFSHGLQHTQALVTDNELHTIQAAAFEPLEKADPTGLILQSSWR